MLFDLNKPLKCSKHSLNLWQALQANNSNGKDIDQTSATVGLGLAVLAGLCRLPELAINTDAVEKIPLLMKVCTSLSVHGFPCLVTAAVA